MSTITTAEQDRDALVERLFGATIASLELFGVHLGVRLGLYSALAGVADLSVEELADAAGIHPRYAREWLEQQAVAGFLIVSGEGGARRFALPPGHRAVLADPQDPAHVAPFALMVAGIGQALPDVVRAYREGGGVSWEAYGADVRDGQAAINRPAFEHEMAGWLAAMPDVHERLLAAPAARVADIGCGAGWSTIAMARAYPGVEVEGFDLDVASVEQARSNAEAAGLADRVHFTVRDASDPELAGRFDLVTVFEALHDMARPTDALVAMRRLLAPDGVLLVVDERVADTFTAPGDEVERMMYGWSVLCCLPGAMVEQPSEAIGTVLRVPTMQRLAADAGFASVEVLPVDNDFFRFYRLTPTPLS